MTNPCDKCRNAATAAESCRDCGAVYRRCDEHGGAAGARRSIHSHRALGGGRCVPPIGQRTTDARTATIDFESIRREYNRATEPARRVQLADTLGYYGLTPKGGAR